MSTSPATKLPVQPENKAAKKKRTKGEASPSVSGAVSASLNVETPAPSDPSTNDVSGGQEPVFLKDLQKYCFRDLWNLKDIFAIQRC
jgi:hypothetical protein